MAQCPECQTEQSADFGMTTCNQCNAVFMVGMDGEVAGAEAETDEGEALLAEASFEEEAADEVVESFEGMGEPSFEQSPETVEEPMETLAEEDFESPSEYSENFLDDLSSSDPLEIQHFDQSQTSVMEDGEYIYEVLVTGIDSSALKKDVLLALSEKRFSLVTSELQKEIQRGALTLRHLNPVLAMLIVLRLQSLDVTVEWRQKHFAQDSSEKESEVDV
jgi:hypothetical protein